MIIRDKFYEDLLNSCGELKTGMVDDLSVCIWNKVNPVIFSQNLIEELDYYLADVERLPNRAIRICQYRFDFYEVYSEYSIVLFTVSEIPNIMSDSYWNRLTEWLISQGYSNAS